MMMETPVTTIKEKPPLKLRHELKHRISYSDDQACNTQAQKTFPA